MIPANLQDVSENTLVPYSAASLVIARFSSKKEWSDKSRESILASRREPALRFRSHPEGAGWILVLYLEMGYEFLRFFRSGILSGVNLSFIIKIEAKDRFAPMGGGCDR